jgi:hypothetical protein
MKWKGQRISLLMFSAVSLETEQRGIERIKQHASAL